MPTFQTTAGPGGGPAWQPLGTLDYAAVGVTTVVDVAAALLMVHVVSNAGWPPYTAAIPQIIVFSSLAATVAAFGVSLRYGMWGADGEAIGCTAVACLVWLGLGALFSTAFLRVYRYHDVLVKQSGVMWPIVSQLIGFMIPFTLAPAFQASPDLGAFDANSLECQSVSRVPEFFAFGAMGVLALGSVVMAFRLRVARVQAPWEFSSAVSTSLTLLAAAVALPLAHSKLETDREARRAAMLVITALTSLGVVGSPVVHPLKSFIVNEEKLETSGDYFLGEWRPKNRTQYMRLHSSMFKEAASSEREIEGFPAIAECFRVIMAREEIESYPLLQASTMRILDTYFRKDDPTAAAVSLSDTCRGSTLRFRASSAFIFDRARVEMLEKMGVGKVPLPEEPARNVARSQSSATAGTSSQSPASEHGQAVGACGSPPPPSKASSTTSSLNYSTDSDLSHPSGGFSPLHQPLSPSSLSPGHAADAPSEAPVSPQLNYRADRAVDRNRHKKKDEAGASSRGGGGRKNPIYSLFGRIGGGGASTRARVQDGDGRSDPADEPPPPVVHMGDDHDDGLDDDDVYGAPPLEQGQATKTLGRAGGGTGVRTVAKVADVHAAFGLDIKDDEDDEETGGQQHRSTGFLGGAINKIKKRSSSNNRASSVVSDGIGGYGSVLNSCSSSPDGSNDLAEAARAIPKPLFGDSSRAVGRQNARASLKKGGTTTTTTTTRSSLNSSGTAAGTASEASNAVAVAVAGNATGNDDDDNNSSRTTSSSSAAAATAANTTTTRSSTSAAGLRGNSLDLADAYGLDLAEEGGATSEAEPSPPPKTATVNPLFGGSELGGGGGSRVKAMARAFDAEARAQAVSAGVVAVDNNKIGLPGRKARTKKPRGGKKGSRGASRRMSSVGSSLQVDVFTIAEAGEGEEEEDEEAEGDDEATGGGNDQNV